MPEFIMTKQGPQPLPPELAGADLDRAAAAILAAFGPPDPPADQPPTPAVPAEDEE